MKISERARLAAAPGLLAALTLLGSAPVLAFGPYDGFAQVQTPAQPVQQLNQQMFNIASVLQGGGSPVLTHSIPAPMDATTMAARGLNWDGMGPVPFAFQSPWSFSTTKDFNTVTQFNPGFVTPYFDANGVLDAGSAYAPWNSLPAHQPFIAPYVAPATSPYGVPSLASPQDVPVSVPAPLSPLSGVAI